MHICFCIPAMNGGGAERTVSNLLWLLHGGGLRVTLLTYEAPAAVSAYPLPEIPILRLDLLGGRGFSRITKILARRRGIRHAIQRIDPDVVVAFMDTMNITVLLALRGLSKPVIISERIDPAHHSLAGWKRIMRRLVYPSARHLVVQTQRVAQYFHWMDNDKLGVIPNPVHPNEKAATPDVPGGDGRFRVVAVGRLSAQKGFEELIGAFANLSESFPLWDLYIYGEGEERNALDEMVHSIGAEGRVFLPGWRPDIEQVYSSAHLMAFPSRYEGFPNALCEAAAAGLPLIGFDGVSGVEEIIVDGENGILIGDTDRTEGLRVALSALMTGAHLRRSMGQQAKQKIGDWRPERIAGMWQSLFQMVCDSSRH
jgi:glycosyltransferase involved in cell wall biosynthesis